MSNLSSLSLTLVLREAREGGTTRKAKPGTPSKTETGGKV